MSLQQKLQKLIEFYKTEDFTQEPIMHDLNEDEVRGYCLGYSEAIRDVVLALTVVMADEDSQ